MVSAEMKLGVGLPVVSLRGNTQIWTHLLNGRKLCLVSVLST